MVVRGKGKSTDCFSSFDKFFIASRWRTGGLTRWRSRYSGCLEYFQKGWWRLSPAKGTLSSRTGAGSRGVLAVIYISLFPSVFDRMDWNRTAMVWWEKIYSKWRNLQRVSAKTLKKSLELLNSRPRKILGFSSLEKLFEREMSNTELCT